MRESENRGVQNTGPGNVNISKSAIGDQAAVSMTGEVMSQRSAIEAFLRELRRELSRLPLPPTQLEIVTADLDAAEAQLRSPAPRSDLLRGTVSALREVALGVAGSGAFAGLVELAQRIHL